MRKIKVEDAIGQVLCHDMTGISKGKKGVAFRRGHIITREDIPLLLDIGKNHVFVWEPDADEVHEDEASLAVVRAACGEGITYDEKPSEGKVFLYARQRGLFCINSGVLKELNSVEDYTIACLPNLTDVSAGAKLGGVRIVPLVTKLQNMENAVNVAEKYHPIFKVLPYAKLKCGVIITGSEVFYGRIDDKFEPIMRKKLDNFNAEILGVTKCPDDLDEIQSAVMRFVSQGAQLILLTGGMSVDPDDLTPTAIRNSGARVVTQGVPMQPGNMLMIAYLDKTVLIGVPGASMHSPTTSLDVFLPRIFAGLDIRPEDIPGLGEGGFCSGCTACTYPRCYFGMSR
ncbi:MAG: molybdopterin-binding protein [Oscillospiraceae bacterium]|nr:molybdopterin-binding protein [Oscillospiraceae bacterium]